MRRYEPPQVTPDWKNVPPGGIGRKKPGVSRRARLLRRARTQRLILATGLCEAQTDVCTRYGTQFHHVLPRSRGGGHTVENGLLVCADCHSWIHAHPSISRQAGWMR